MKSNNTIEILVSTRLGGIGKPIARSEGKGLLKGLDQFNVVIFDFEGVECIGQAFADEVFRVFASKHPGIELHEMNANAEVKRMIKRARG